MNLGPWKISRQNLLTLLLSALVVIFWSPGEASAQNNLIAPINAPVNSWWQFFKDPGPSIVATFLWILLNLSFILVTLFAFALDYAIRIGAGIIPITNTTVYNLQAIGDIWTALRDVANLGFIFILVYIAARTILGLDSQGQKQVVMVVIIALFINFSAFGARLVIDAGNAVTTIAYNQISYAEGAGDKGGLANHFIGLIGLQSLVNDKIRNPVSNSLTNDLWTFSAAAFFAIFYSLMLAYVFAVGASIFVVRTVKLVLYIIFSPLAFISKATPGLSGNFFGTWLKGILEQAAVGPVYIVLVLLCAKISAGLIDSTRTGSLGEAISQLVGGNLGVGFASFFVITGMMLYFLWWSAQTSLAMAGSFAGYVPSIVKSAGLLAAGAAGRGSVGAASAGLAKLYNNLEARLKGSATIQGAGRALDKFSKSKVTIGARGFLAGFSLGASEVAIRAGSGMVKGTAQYLNEGAKAVLKKGAEAKFGTQYSYKSREEEDKKLSAEVKERKDVIDREKAVKEGTGELKDAGGDKDKERDARDKIEKAVNKMTDKELEALDMAILANEAVVRALSPRQIEFLQKSEKISTTDKTRILEVRNAPIKAASDILKSTTSTDAQKEEARKIVRAVAQKELEGLPTEMYTPELIDALSNDQHKDLLKSPNLTATRKAKVKSDREAPIKGAFAGATRVYDTKAGDYAEEKRKIEEVKKRIKGMNLKDVAGLDKEILTHPDMLAFYTPTYLKTLARSGELRTDKIEAIREAFKREDVVIDASLMPGVPGGRRKDPNPQQKQIQETIAWLNDKGEGKGRESF